MQIGGVVWPPLLDRSHSAARTPSLSPRTVTVVSPLPHRRLVEDQPPRIADLGLTLTPHPNASSSCRSHQTPSRLATAATSTLAVVHRRSSTSSAISRCHTVDCSSGCCRRDSAATGPLPHVLGLFMLHCSRLDLVCSIIYH